MRTAESEQHRQQGRAAGAGPVFDRKFAHTIAREQRHELEMVHDLRNRCVEPQICELLGQMEPQLERSVSSAESLTAAVAIDDPRP